MIDLHFHCLPAVDDGPSRLELSVEMCRQAANDGCEAIVATPHQNHNRWPNNRPDSLRKLLARLRDAVGERPRLHLGGEIRVGSDLLDNLRDPRLAGLLPLAGSRYLLLEFSRSGPGPNPEDLVHELTLAGWTPILAHPEMIEGLGDDLELLHRLVAAGARLQITAMSLTGRFGRRLRNRALKLLDAELVHFLASDAHDLERRPPGLSEARDLAAARIGARAARSLTADNPRAVLEDKPLPLIHAVGSST